MKKGDLLNAIVGDFVVCASAPSTPRGDAMWEVACQCCGRHYTMRATDIRKALREGSSPRVCECVREIQKAETKVRQEMERQRLKEERARLKIEKPKQRSESALYKEEHILLYYT